MLWRCRSFVVLCCFYFTFIYFLFDLYFCVIKKRKKKSINLDTMTMFQFINCEDFILSLKNSQWNNQEEKLRCSNSKP